MNKKIIYLTTFLLLIAMGIIYANSQRLATSESGFRKGCCKDQSTSASNQQKQPTGSEEQNASYMFITDKAGTNELKSSLQKELMGAAGVRDVKFGESCSVSKMTMVTVTYSLAETNPEKLASIIKDKNFDCPKTQGCDMEGCSKEKSSSDGSKYPHGNCNMKNKKTTGKNI